MYQNIKIKHSQPSMIMPLVSDAAGILGSICMYFIKLQKERRKHHAWI